MIRRQKLEIGFDGVSPGVGVQNQISEFFYDQLLPELNILFDELAGDQYLICADNIEIDCGFLTADKWKDELIEHTLKKLKPELTVLYKKPTGEVATKQQLQKDCLFFLEYGFLSWNSSVQSMDAFEKMDPDKSFIEELKFILLSIPPATKGLVYQFPVQLTEKLIRFLALTEGKRDLISHKNPVVSRKEEAEQLITEMISGPDKEPGFPSDSKKEKRNTTDESRLTSDDQLPETTSDGIYIGNAGLVILHPFLPELFKRLGFWRNKQWVDPGYQHDAAHVLAYLHTGKEENPEFVMILNKIMCGIKTSDVLLPPSVLTEFIKSECDELLTEVVHHWTRLKNTSIGALRETFLQRDGKLTRTDHGWLLHIERKGVDVLLGSLPWGIGTIKLPWTDDKLFVEW